MCCGLLWLGVGLRNFAVCFVICFVSSRLVQVIVGSCCMRSVVHGVVICWMRDLFSTVAFVWDFYFELFGRGHVVGIAGVAGVCKFALLICVLFLFRFVLWVCVDDLLISLVLGACDSSDLVYDLNACLSLNLWVLVSVYICYID